MKRTAYFLAIILLIGAYSATVSFPELEDPTNTIPGCIDCHKHEIHNYVQMISVKVLSGNRVQVTVNGLTGNGAIGGELVDTNGGVQGVLRNTKSNPFILQADGPGEYIVYAGGWDKQYKLFWDSAVVVLDEDTKSINCADVRPQIVCQGEDIMLNFTVSQNFNQGNKFIMQLSDVNGAFNNNTKNLDTITSMNGGKIYATIPQNLTPSMNYKIRVSSTNPHVISSNELDFEVLRLPEVEINSGGQTTLCEGSFMVLSAGSNYYSIEWSTGDTGEEIMINEPGEYYVTVENDEGCTGSDTIFIEKAIAPKPVISGEQEITEKSTFFYTTSANVGSVYEWSVTGGDIVSKNEAGNIIEIGWISMGACSVCVSEINEEGCSSDTCLDINTLVSVEEDYESISAVNIFPNPINSVGNIEFYMPEAGYAGFELISLLGDRTEIAENAYFSPGKQAFRFDAGNLSSGLYLYKLFVNGEIRTGIIIISK